MLKLFYKLYYFLPFFISWQMSYAQQIPETLSLTKALDLAVQTYPSVKIKLAELEAVKAEVEARKTNYTLPTITFQAQALYATSNQIRGTFYPNEGTAIPTSGGIKVNGYTSDAVFSSFSTLLASYKVINFGKKRAEETFSNISIENANADVERELFEHKIRVTDSFLMSIVYEEAVKIQQKNLDRTLAFYQAIFANTNAGLRPGVDSSLAATEVSKAKILLIESQRITNQQKNKLAELLGGHTHNFVLASERFNESFPDKTLLENNQGLEANPILKYFQKRIDLSIAKIDVIQKSYLPSIMARGAVWARGSGITDKTDATGNFIYDSSLSGLGFRAYDYMLGFTTLWNISDIFRVKQEVKAQKSLSQSYREHYNQVKLQLEEQQENADLQLRTSLEINRQAPIQLASAQSAYNQAKARYEAGLSTIIELSQAINVLNRAEIDLIVANNNVWRAVFLKSASRGDLSTFLNQLK